MTAHYRILLIEDNPGDARQVREMLRGPGVRFEVETAERLADGVRRLQGGGLDLTLLDLDLPDSQGQETLVRVQAAAPEVPVVVMTGTDDVDLALRAVQAGAQDYLVKGQLHEGLLRRSVCYAIERKQAEEALRASERKYRHFFEQDLAGHYVSTADGRLLACNSAFARLLGFASEGEATEARVTALYTSPEARDIFLGRLRNHGRVEHFETELRRKDGTPVHVIQSATAVRTDDGSDLREIHGFLIDDTARKEAEREFLQAQKMEAVGRLAGSVAHDFNNVLGVILGSVELLQRSFTAGDPQLEKLGQIRDAAEHAAILTRQLLAFSRRQVLKPRVLDLTELVRGMEPMLSRLIGEDIELVTRLPGGLGRIMADEGQIQQVLMNLAVNSRDAMADGGRLRIEITEERTDPAHLALRPDVAPGPYVVLSVSDTGQGMDATTLAHVFEPFFTTKPAGQGTGLGLATVYGIVKQSGGHIEVETEPGKGAAFRVYLPMTERAAEPAPTDVLSPSARGGSETILLLEDDATLRSLVHEILEQAGYTVLSAAGPEDALAAVSLHSGPIELLISDVIMPGGSGPEFAAQLLALRPRAQVLYMSGYTDEGIARHGVLEAGVRLLQKPFASEALLRAVRAALEASPPVTS
jgi:PAS domain S-box-containing protein